ncbi:MAG: DUF1700 domain-containing protein [Syntrophomonadaceae bacterium]|nr:DUF1700 domain-containing protein [Syntrophomonadaceae bacterium]
MQVNKSDFLKDLEQMLVELPPDSRQRILSYYEDLFTTRLNEGLTEEEIIVSIESPQSLANYHIAEYLLDTAENNLTTPNIFRVMRATLRLGFSNLILLIGPILGIIGALLAFVSTSALVIATGLILLIGVFTDSISKIFFFTPPDFFYENTITSAGTFFLSIGLVAFGLLFLIGAYILMRLIYRGTLKHIRFHLVKNKGDKKYVASYKF